MFHEVYLGKYITKTCYFQVLATTVGKLADVSPSIPISMFAFSALLSASLSILLPETQVTTYILVILGFLNCGQLLQLSKKIFPVQFGKTFF